MIDKINPYFRKKENLRKVQIFAGLLILLALFGNQLPVETQSVFTFLGGTIAFSFVLLAVGIVLIVIPEPVTTATGIVMVGVAILISGASMWVFFKALPSPFGIPIWAILILVAGYIFVSRKSKRRTLG